MILKTVVEVDKVDLGSFSVEYLYFIFPCGFKDFYGVRIYFLKM